MILIIEQDTRTRNGRRWNWKPILFRALWRGDKQYTWRIGWSMWSLSYYPDRGLRDFFDHIESGRTAWRKA